MRKMEVYAGNSIDRAIDEALTLAKAKGDDVTFNFNGVDVVVTPTSDAAAVESKWRSDFDAEAERYRNSPEAKEAQERREQEARQARIRFAAQVETLKTASEKELRELKMGWPVTLEEVDSVITALAERNQDYGTCVYAMSIAAEAAYKYIAHVLGVTGFQASCADMDFIRRTRLIDGPFALIKGNDMLFPQYDIPARVQEMLGEWRPWAAEQAKIKLAEGGHAHPNVKAHWELLAGTRSDATVSALSTTGE